MTLEQIADEIYQPEVLKTPQDMVNQFEKYAAKINSLHNGSSGNSYTIYTRLNADYSIALTSIGNHKKAIPFLNKSISLLLNDKAIEHEQLKNVKFYEALLFNRGVSNYYNKEFGKAQGDFQILLSLYPDSAIYKDWLKCTERRKLKKISNILWISLAGILILENLLKQSGIAYKTVIWINAIVLMTVVILEIFIYLRKGRTNHAIET